MILKIQKLFSTLALSDGQITTEIEKMTGQHLTADLVRNAADGQPITAIAADAICTWLSKQYGREIKPSDTDLRVHPASTLPGSANAQEAMSDEQMLAILKASGYTVTRPALRPEPMYEDGDYLRGDLHPRNWRALSNRRVPWPQGIDPKTALHELAPFMTYRLLTQEAAQRGRDISAFVKPDEEI